MFPEQDLSIWEGLGAVLLSVAEQQDSNCTLPQGAERMGMAGTLLASLSTWDFLLASQGRIIPLQVFGDVVFRKAWFCLWNLKCTSVLISGGKCTLISEVAHKQGILINNPTGKHFWHLCVCPYL